MLLQDRTSARLFQYHSITVSHITLRALFAVIQHADAAIQRPCLLHGACFHIPKGTHTIDIRWPGHGYKTLEYTRIETKRVWFYLQCLPTPHKNLNLHFHITCMFPPINCSNNFPLDWFILVCSSYSSSRMTIHQLLGNHAPFVPQQ